MRLIGGHGAQDGYPRKLFTRKGVLKTIFGLRCHIISMKILEKVDNMIKHLPILSLVIFMVIFSNLAFAQTFDETKAKAVQGDARAQYNLALMYDKGEGVKQDLMQAKLWYDKAAAQGFAPAQYNLALMYYKGEGVKQDLTRAKLWWEKAAVQGYAQAQYNLGIAYYKGEGVKQDLAQAKLWWEKAAAQGHDQAQYSLGYMSLIELGPPQKPNNKD
jgi:TPR repeat protein